MLLIFALSRGGEALGQTLRVITPPQGGTGIGTAAPADVGDCLTVLDDSPFTYTLGPCGSGSGGGDSLWATSTTNANDIYNTELGNVTIGTTTTATDPSTVLKVVATSTDTVWLVDFQNLNGSSLSQLTTNGSWNINVGDLQLLLGNIDVNAGNITADVGDVVSTSGNISALSGTVTGDTLFSQSHLRFDGEIEPDGATCSNGEILKKTGANDWDCAADSTGSGTGGDGGDTKWATSTVDSTAIYPNGALKVGIGTSTPMSVLSVTGTSTVAGNFQVLNGSMFAWDRTFITQNPFVNTDGFFCGVGFVPGRDAFRGGCDNDNTNWTTAKLGINSFAYGDDVEATAFDSVAFGNNSATAGDYSLTAGRTNTITSTGDYSVALGQGNTVSGDRAVAIGQNNTTSGFGTVLLGTTNTANGGNQVLIGKSNTANGTQPSFIFGDSNVTDDDESVAIGQGNTATGYSSVALGQVNYATAANAFAFGNDANSTGVSSYTYGENIRASALNSLAFGRGTGASTELTNDQANSIYFGVNSTIPTLVVTGSGGAGLTGNVGIGTTTPAWTLQVASSTRPQLTLTDPSSTYDHWSFYNVQGNLNVATSSPTTYATSTASAISIDNRGAVTFGSRLLTCTNLTGSSDLCDGSDGGGAGSIDGTGFAGMMTSWVDTDTLTATSAPTGAYFTATSTAATSSLPRILATTMLMGTSTASQSGLSNYQGIEIQNPSFAFNTILSGDAVMIRDYRQGGGGWARTIAGLENQSGTNYWGIGGFGPTGQSSTYGWIGQDYNSAALKWDSSNRVGVGLASTNAPTYPLQVVGAAQVSSFVDASHFTATSTTATSTLPNISNTNFLIGGDTFNELVGTGLQVTGGALQTTLGTSITVGELASADFGDWTCGGVTCLIDADSVALGTDTTGNYAAGDGEAGNVAADKVLESSLKAVDSATDEDILTYESTTGDFEWHTCAQITGSADLCDGSDASGGGGGSDFTFENHYGVTTAATSSQVHFIDAVYASSTLRAASTTIAGVLSLPATQLAIDNGSVGDYADGFGDAFFGDDVEVGGALITTGSVYSTQAGMTIDISDSPLSSGNLGTLILANGDRLSVGSGTGAVAYSYFGDVTTGFSSLNSDDDLGIEGNFEVDGNVRIDGDYTGTGDYTHSLSGSENVSITGTAFSTADIGVFNNSVSSSQDEARGFNSDFSSTCISTGCNNEGAYYRIRGNTLNPITGTETGITGVAARFEATRTVADTTSGFIGWTAGYFTATQTGSTNAGLKYTEAGRFEAVGDTNGTSSTTAAYFSATGADTNYNIIAAGTALNGFGTTTPTKLVDVFSTATTTTRIDSSSLTQGACLVLKDRDGVGYSYVTVSNGVMTTSTTSCE